MRWLAVLLLAVGVSFGSASAAELPVRDVLYGPAYTPMYVAPVPVIYNWTGLYVGGHGGGTWGDSRLIFQPVNAFGTQLSGADVSGISLSGSYIGGQLGYNYQLLGRPWVIGLELDSSFGHIRRSNTVPAFLGVSPTPLIFVGTPPLPIANSFATLAQGLVTTAGDMDYLGSLRARLGYAVDRFLMYGTLGMAWTHDTITIVSPSLQTSTLSNTQTHIGVAVGAGLEYAFLNNFSARIEYLYTSYTHEDTFFPDVISGGIGVKANVQAVRGAINYLFQYPR
jgi:outer membrane immunogenic protein